MDDDLHFINIPLFDIFFLEFINIDDLIFVGSLYFSFAATLFGV